MRRSKQYKRRISKRSKGWLLLLVVPLGVAASAFGYAMKEKPLPDVAPLEQIPSEIREAYEQNKELADFAKDYPAYHTMDFQGVPDEYRLGEIPAYYQWDKRWGYTIYGDTYLGLSGCGPTVLSMAASYLLQDGSLTPNRIARFAQQNGYYVEGVGSSWDLMENGAKALGLQTETGELSERIMSALLQEGGVIICSLLPGDFTQSGHFILLAGYDVDQGFLVHDPNSRLRTGAYYTFDQLSGQIAQLWFYKG